MNCSDPQFPTSELDTIEMMKMKLKQQFKILNMISIVLIFSGTALFYTGFHSVDLTHNVILFSISEDFDYTKYGDINGRGQLVSYKNVYIEGWLKIFLGFSLVSGGFLLYGSSIERLTCGWVRN